MDWLKRSLLGKAPEPAARPASEPPRVDRSCQVISLDVPEDTSYDPGEAPLLARPPACRMVPAALLAVKAKAFADGLMAAVELAVDPGRRQLLESWYEACPSDHLAAALYLRGCEIPAPSVVAPFLADPNESKPLGFYTWSPELEAIYRSDRFLQAPLPPSEAARLEATMQPEPYRAQLELTARLTNPLSAGSLLSQGPDRALLPPSRSVESWFARALLGTAPVPEGFDLVRELIQALQAGRLSLRPPPDGGWYAHQQWPLEALVHDRDNREKSRLERSPRYQKALEEMFRGLFALTRETHIKQLERIALGCAAPGREVVVWMNPELRVEPLVTWYERMAASFSFVRGVLLEALGAHSLGSLRRLTPDGPVESPLDAELDFMIELFAGCAQVACEDLGMGDTVGNSRTALGWLRKWHQDPDLTTDIRCMVPLFYDLGRQKNKVLAVVGYSDRPLEVRFRTPPQVTVSDPNVVVKFGTSHERLVYPVAIEMYVDRLLDREEFRSLCDEHRTLGSLREALA